jgi:anaerobic magnesium-protoporphyrin IX monomethyl ester cyclase
MPKIVFIEPKAPNLHIFSQFYSPRLGSIILGTLMKQRGWEVEILIEENRKVDFNRLQRVDVVGISTITPTAPRAYAIADKLKTLNRQLTVIMGGPHVTYLAEEALEHADFVIRGEGEDALMHFIDAWEDGRDYSGVPNLSYKRDGKLVQNPFHPFVSDLNKLPYPDLSLMKVATRDLAGHTIIPVQTSRGCPFDCSFCSVTGMFGKKFRFRSSENIMEELRQYKKGKHFVFFYDDNFTANRKRAKELLEAMIREKFKFKWSTQVRADVARDIELVKLMKKAGCHTVFIGFESVNPDTLKAMKKKQSVAEIVRAIKVLRRYRIHIHGMFVYGFDEDDWHTVKETVRFARKSRLTSSQFLILTPFPGSEFYNKMQADRRIRFKDWSLYDAHHVVFQPARFFPFDLQRAQIFSHKKFYSLKEMIKKFFRGKWISLALSHYARQLNRVWQKKNKTFLKAISLLTPSKQARISVDYREEICLD